MASAFFPAAVYASVNKVTPGPASFPRDEIAQHRNRLVVVLETDIHAGEIRTHVWIGLTGTPKSLLEMLDGLGRVFGGLRGLSGLLLLPSRRSSCRCRRALRTPCRAPGELRHSLARL